jgi:hypothetical protein
VERDGKGEHYSTSVPRTNTIQVEISNLSQNVQCGRYLAISATGRELRCNTLRLRLRAVVIEYYASNMHVGRVGLQLLASGEDWTMQFQMMA